jgi:hypothetical protein
MILGLRLLFNQWRVRVAMGLMGDVGILIKAGLTVGFMFILYAMGPCGWMCGGTLLVYLTMKEQSV